MLKLDSACSSYFGTVTVCFLSQCKNVGSLIYSILVPKYLHKPVSIYFSVFCDLTSNGFCRHYLCVLSSLLLYIVVLIQMPVDCRRQIVKRALKYARQQQSAKKKISDTLGSALCIALSLVLTRLSMPFLMITCSVVHILQAFSNAIRFCSTHTHTHTLANFGF